MQARRLASALLTDATGRRPAIGLTSYDRLFPSQDVMPDGGFGNLIALPLQHEARDQGCSVFLDDQLDPFADQWRFLAHVGRLDRARLTGSSRPRRRARVAYSASPTRPRSPTNHGGSDARRASADRASSRTRCGSCSPSSSTCRVRACRRTGRPDQAAGGVRESRLLRAPTPAAPGRHVPRLFGCAEEHPEHIALPRGCLDDLETLLADSGVALVMPTIVAPTDLPHGDVHRRADRRTARSRCRAPATRDRGAGRAARRRQDRDRHGADRRTGVSTLVLVATRTLVDQWRARLATFLDIEPSMIGTIQGGRRKASGMIDVATIQTLARDDTAGEALASYGMLVIDECHHVPAISTEKVARLAPARYVLGLTATPSAETATSRSSACSAARPGTRSAPVQRSPCACGDATRTARSTLRTTWGSSRSTGSSPTITTETR